MDSFQASEEHARRVLDAYDDAIRSAQAAYPAVRVATTPHNPLAADEGARSDRELRLVVHHDDPEIGDVWSVTVVSKRALYRTPVDEKAIRGQVAAAFRRLDKARHWAPRVTMRVPAELIERFEAGAKVAVTAVDREALTVTFEVPF
jgi:hypothetical protein